MCKQRELIYVAAPFYGYDIRCRNCGETYGFSSDRDMKYLAALNRNSKLVAGKLGRKGVRRNIGTPGTSAGGRRI